MWHCSRSGIGKPVFINVNISQWMSISGDGKISREEFDIAPLLFEGKYFSHSKYFS